MRKKIILIIILTIIVLAITLICINFNKKSEPAIEDMEKKTVIGEEVKEKEIFEGYYEQANAKLQELTLEEKIGQIFLVRYPNENAKEVLKQYKFGGYLLFEKDFKGKTEKAVQDEIART